MDGDGKERRKGGRPALTQVVAGAAHAPAAAQRAPCAARARGWALPDHLSPARSQRVVDPSCVCTCSRRSWARERTTMPPNKRGVRVEARCSRMCDLDVVDGLLETINANVLRGRQVVAAVGLV